MSSAKAIRPGPRRARLSIVGELADRQRREKTQGAATWRDPIELGRSLDLTWAATMAQVNRAEMFGLIERKEIKAGERVALSDLGWKLFGLDDRRPMGTHRVSTLPDVEGRHPLVQLLIHWPAAVALVHAGSNDLAVTP